MTTKADNDWLLVVKTPHMTGQRVKDMQWQMSGHNRFNHRTYFGAVDGDFGKASGEAAREMKFYLGYPTNDCVPTAGPVLRAYLLPKTAPGAMLLPSAYQKRKKERAENLSHYPLGRVGTLIGFPGQGTHSWTNPPNNWESDNACDIAIPVGTPVLACFTGEIGTAFGPLDSSNPRFAGLRLHLVGEKDEAYYAHLSKFRSGLAPGDTVEAGDLLGYSGSANGVAHLHWALKVGYPPTFLRNTSAV